MNPTKVESAVNRKLAPVADLFDIETVAEAALHLLQDHRRCDTHIVEQMLATGVIVLRPVA